MLIPNFMILGGYINYQMILQNKPIITGRIDKNIFENAKKQTGEDG